MLVDEFEGSACLALPLDQLKNERTRSCSTPPSSADVLADATAVWVALHGTVSLRTALPRFPWPDPAASVRQLVLPLAKVTA